MSARIPLGVNSARAYGAGGRGSRSAGAGGAGGGPGRRLGAPPARRHARRDFPALPRTALRARDRALRELRQPRAACPAMLDLFLHVWDDLDDS